MKECRFDIQLKDVTSLHAASVTIILTISMLAIGAKNYKGIPLFHQ